MYTNYTRSQLQKLCIDNKQKLNGLDSRSKNDVMLNALISKGIIQKSKEKIVPKKLSKEERKLQKQKKQLEKQTIKEKYLQDLQSLEQEEVEQQKERESVNFAE